MAVMEALRDRARAWPDPGSGWSRRRPFFVMADLAENARRSPRQKADDDLAAGAGGRSADRRPVRN